MLARPLGNRVGQPNKGLGTDQDGADTPGDEFNGVVATPRRACASVAAPNKNQVRFAAHSIKDGYRRAYCCRLLLSAS